MSLILLFLCTIAYCAHITVFEDCAFIIEETKEQVLLLPEGTVSENVFFKGRWEYRKGAKTQEDLFEASIGDEVVVTTEEEKIKGTLSAVYPGGLLLRIRERDVFFVKEKIKSILLPSTPLLPHILFEEEGEKTVSYLTDAISYKSVYQLHFDDKETYLSCFAHVKNKGGKKFANSTLSIVVGKPKREKEEKRLFLKALSERQEEALQKPSPFFEYYIYRIKEPIDLFQEYIIPLFLKEEVPFKKIYVYKRTLHPLHVATYIEIQNENKRPFGEGIVNIYKEGKFLGQDTFPFLAKDEKARICVGLCTDIVCERKILSFKRLKDEVEQEIQIKVKNKKMEKIECEVIEEFPEWREVRILNANTKYEMIEAQKIKFLLTLSPNTEKEILYTVLQR